MIKDARRLRSEPPAGDKQAVRDKLVEPRALTEK